MKKIKAQNGSVTFQKSSTYQVAKLDSNSDISDSKPLPQDDTAFP